MSSREKITFVPKENQPQVEPQQGVFTDSSLTPVEEAMVSSVLNWDHPEALVPYIEEVFGRSFILRSPDQSSSPEAALLGEYDGLQVLGLGGVVQAVQGGLRFEKETLHISPVDDQNHADELEAILQTSSIDKSGQIQLKTATYAPLHGMTAESAQRRRYHSQQLQGLVDTYRQAGKKPLFVLPQFVAEGQLTNKFDAEGNPLVFQVYRVPLVRRLPNQIIESMYNDSYTTGMAKSVEANYAIGRVLRGLHVCRYVYGDPHLGNMSHIESQLGNTMYITDLGNAKDIENEQLAVQRKYLGLDLAIAIYSQLELAKHLSVLFSRTDKNTFSITNLTITHLTALLGGYFVTELSRQRLTHPELIRLAEQLALRLETQDVQQLVDLLASVIEKYQVIK